MIGDRLKELRTEKKLTQQEISKMIGVNQNTYSYYETNKIQPDIATLIKLADIYKVSLDYIADRFSK